MFPSLRGRLSDHLASVLSMNPIAFVPSSRALFLSDSAESNTSQVTQALFEKLRQQGWPTQVRLLLPGTELAFRVSSGVMVDLLDAISILLAPDMQNAVWDSRELHGIAKVVRLALSLVSRGQAWPKLSRIGTGSRHSARWKAAMSQSERTELVGIGKELSLCVGELLSTPLSTERWQNVVSGHSLASLLLHATVDMIVREGCRRGAQVRLAECSAKSWEQRLVLALSDEKGLLLAPNPSDDEFCQRSSELNDWSQSALSSASRPLLPSPTSWQASESLQQIVSRFVRQAGLLSTVLLSGQAAPRMLPTSAWRTTTMDNERKAAVLPRKLLDEALQLLRDQRPPAATNHHQAA